MIGVTLAHDASTLIESNAHEAADLVGELTLLLDRIGDPDPGIAGARLAARRLADRLAQIVWLYRVESGGAHLNADAWAPAELIDELEREARSLARGRLRIARAVTEVAPAHWFMDRDLVAGALRNIVHSAFVYARAQVTIGLQVRAGFLGFCVQDDAGAFPDQLIAGEAPVAEPERCNGNALGIHFARAVAQVHRRGERRGYVELANRTDGAGTQFVLWLP